MMQEFFNIIRQAFGPLDQHQVDGFNVILKATEGMLINHRAYILATAWHETARTMQPIAEYGKGKGRPYGVPAGKYGHIYYGRGYVQLTWMENYKKAGLATGRDLVQFPEQAMIPEIAADIIVRGMSQGWFTGKKLSDYQPFDYANMRRIVNGSDKALTIASYANTMETALRTIPPVHKPPDIPILDFQIIEASKHIGDAPKFSLWEWFKSLWK